MSTKNKAKKNTSETASQSLAMSKKIAKVDEADSKSQKRMYTLNIIIIIGILIGIFVYMHNVDGFDNILHVLQSADYKWMIAGLVCLILMWLCETITFHFPFKKIYRDQTFFDSFRANMIGQLFNNLTPFASGGQLMEAYVLKKEGRRASDAFSVLTMKFVITQTTLILFTLVVVFTQFKFFINLFKNLVWIGIIGIIINIGIVVLFFLMGINKDLVIKMIKPLVVFAGKIHIGKFRLIKDPDEKMAKFIDSANNFSLQFSKIRKQNGLLVIMTVFGLIQNILYYAITYMVYRAFGNVGATFFQIVTTQAFLMLIMTIFPTPGAGIGAEGGFLLLFSSIFKKETLSLSILFWRIYVFYLPIILGALFFIPAKRKENIE